MNDDTDSGILVFPTVAQGSKIIRVNLVTKLGIALLLVSVGDGCTPQTGSPVQPTSATNISSSPVPNPTCVVGIATYFWPERNRTFTLNYLGGASAQPGDCLVKDGNKVVHTVYGFIPGTNLDTDVMLDPYTHLLTSDGPIVKGAEPTESFFENVHSRGLNVGSTVRLRLDSRHSYSLAHNQEFPAVQVHYTQDTAGVRDFVRPDEVLTFIKVGEAFMVAEIHGNFFSGSRQLVSLQSTLTREP